MFRLLSSIILFGGALLMACQSSRSLRDVARPVLLLYQADMGPECVPLANISTGSLRPRSVQEGQITLRNNAADMGANAVLFELYNPGQEATGKALRCTPAFVHDYRAAREAELDHQADNEDTNSLEVGPRFISDLTQRIIWQRCSYGQSQAAEQCEGTPSRFTWESAITYCRTLDLDDRRWRLPTIDELRSLVSRRPNNGLYINTSIFPGTPADVYWSSSLFNESPAAVRVVDFGNGKAFGYGSQNPGYVRCVSDR